MGKGSDFNPGFSFDFGPSDAPIQAPWEFSGAPAGRSSSSALLGLGVPGRPCLPAARSGRARARAAPPPTAARNLPAGALKQAIKDEGTFQTTSIDHKIKQHLDSKGKSQGGRKRSRQASSDSDSDGPDSEDAPLPGESRRPPRQAEQPGCSPGAARLPRRHVLLPVPAAGAALAAAAAGLVPGADAAAAAAAAAGELDSEDSGEGLLAGGSSEEEEQLVEDDDDDSDGDGAGGGSGDGDEQQAGSEEEEEGGSEEVGGGRCRDGAWIQHAVCRVGEVATAAAG
jgi:hypothetical protein